MTSSHIFGMISFSTSTFPCSVIGPLPYTGDIPAFDTHLLIAGLFALKRKLRNGKNLQKQTISGKVLRNSNRPLHAQSVSMYCDSLRTKRQLSRFLCNFCCGKFVMILVSGQPRSTFRQVFHCFAEIHNIRYGFGTLN